MTKGSVPWRGYFRLAAVYIGAFILIWAVRWIPANWDMDRECRTPNPYSLDASQASPHVPNANEISACLNERVFDQATQSTILWFLGIPLGLVALVLGYLALRVLRRTAMAIVGWVGRGFDPR